MLSNSIEYTFFSYTHDTLSKTDLMIGNKTSLNKFTEIEVTSSIFSDHNSMKIEICNRQKVKITNTWKLSNTLLSSQWTKEEIKKIS